MSKDSKGLWSMEDMTKRDIIWKDHLDKEKRCQLYSWPRDWGFLVEEYDEVTREIGGPTGPKAPENRCVNNPAVPLKLPPVFKTEVKLPLTTSGYYGSRIVNRTCQEIQLPMQEHARRVKTILKTFKWPDLFA